MGSTPWCILLTWCRETRSKTFWFVCLLLRWWFDSGSSRRRHWAATCRLDQELSVCPSPFPQQNEAIGRAWTGVRGAARGRTDLSFPCCPSSDAEASRRKLDLCYIREYMFKDVSGGGEGGLGMPNMKEVFLPYLPLVSKNLPSISAWETPARGKEERVYTQAVGREGKVGASLKLSLSNVQAPFRDAAVLGSP